MGSGGLVCISCELRLERKLTPRAHGAQRRSVALLSSSLLLPRPGLLYALRCWARPRPCGKRTEPVLWLLSRHSVVSIFATPWTAAHKASLSLTISQSLLKLMSNESMMPSNHLILCRPLLLLPSVFSSIRVFSNELTLPIRWPKYWF